MTGTKVDDKITLRLQAGRPDKLEVDVGDDGSADFRFDRKHIAAIEVDAASGDDLVRIDESNGVFTDSIPTTIDGGDGNDTIAGGTGNETLLGGDGNDTIDGNGGNDVAFLGAGDDTFVWDPGDGSDTIEGQDGADTMLFNGANANERVALSANGNRLLFLRSPANITMDTNGVETVDFNALGGADIVTVDDLTGTDVNAVNVDLAGNPRRHNRRRRDRPRLGRRHRRRRQDQRERRHIRASRRPACRPRSPFSTRTRLTYWTSRASAATTTSRQLASPRSRSPCSSTAETETTSSPAARASRR